MKRILVSGASGIVGYGVLRSLKQMNAPCFLLGTSLHTDSVAPAFCDVFEPAPNTNSDEYIDWLLAMLHRHSIDLFIPGIEADMYCWSAHLAELRSSNALPLLNNPTLIELCRDKWSFYQRLEQAGVACAITSSLENDFALLEQQFSLPFLLKPRSGFGSKGIVRVTSEEVFNRHRAAVGAILMAQPIVGNDLEEYTVSAFGNGKGNYYSSIALKRSLSGEGFTDKAEVVDQKEFAPVLVELCSLLNPIGPTNFQFRRAATGWKLLEVNPRISSSTSIRTAFGYNECAMSLDFFLNCTTPSQPSIHRGRAVRYTDEKIFYEDGFHF